MFSEQSVYPQIKVSNNPNPHKGWAIPIVGGLAKGVTIYGQIYGVIIFMFLVLPILGFINSFNVLLNGRYWRFYYDQIASFTQFYSEVMFFAYGVTDRYPSFRPKDVSQIVATVVYPENPNRLFAIPLLGGIVRIILLIPFFIYQYVIGLAAGIAVMFSFLVVLIANRYPETTFELARDSLRLGFSAMLYMSGISDKYPSFWISLNHKVAKLLLIALSILYLVLNMGPMTAGFMSAFNGLEKNTEKVTEDDFNKIIQDMPQYNEDTQYNYTETYDDTTTDTYQESTTETYQNPTN